MIKKVINRMSRIALQIIKRRYKLDIIERKPRYKAGSYVYKGKRFKFPDGASFAAIFREVLESEIYKFNTKIEKPYIIDCGANVGLSVIYFKTIYPDAEVIAFEPDTEIFSYLESNTSQYVFKDTQILNLGVWKENGFITFKNEGADGGRISFEFDTLKAKSNQEIEVVRLSNYINKTVALLKIDIEGAELDVLNEIESKLHHVEKIFIEYHSFENSAQNLDVILNILSRNGFRYYLDCQSRIRQRPFIDKTIMSSFDFLINIYATKESAELDN